LFLLSGAAANDQSTPRYLTHLIEDITGSLVTVYNTFIVGSA